MYTVYVQTNGFDDVYARVSDLKTALERANGLKSRANVERIYIVLRESHSIVWNWNR